jgi:hypothetical protein
MRTASAGTVTKKSAAMNSQRCAMPSACSRWRAYDLGRSLRLAGDPADAAKVLYQRLQIPNQTETVRARGGNSAFCAGAKGGIGGAPVRNRALVGGASRAVAGLAGATCVT